MYCFFEGGRAGSQEKECAEANPEDNPKCELYQIKSILLVVLLFIKLA